MCKMRAWSVRAGAFVAWVLAASSARAHGPQGDRRWELEISVGGMTAASFAHHSQERTTPRARLNRSLPPTR